MCIVLLSVSWYVHDKLVRECNRNYVYNKNPFSLCLVIYSFPNIQKRIFIFFNVHWITSLILILQLLFCLPGSEAESEPGAWSDTRGGCDTAASLGAWSGTQDMFVGVFQHFYGHDSDWFPFAMRIQLDVTCVCISIALAARARQQK